MGEWRLWFRCLRGTRGSGFAHRPRKGSTPVRSSLRHRVALIGRFSDLTNFEGRAHFRDSGPKLGGGVYVVRRLRPLLSGGGGAGVRKACWGGGTGGGG